MLETISGIHPGSPIEGIIFLSILLWIPPFSSDHRHDVLKMTTSTNAPAVAFILGMSEPRSRPISETKPSLAEVQQDPTILTGLPLPVIVDLRRQISHLAADVDAVLYRTLTEIRTKDQRSGVEPDRLLTPEAAAARYGVTKRWLLDHAEEIPGVRRLSRKIVRFSERRLARFLERTPV
jgi:hypothetical protein